MRAIVTDGYGSLDVLHLRDVDTPVPRPDQLLDPLADQYSVQRLGRPQQRIAESRDRHPGRPAHVRHRDRHERDGDPDRMCLETLPGQQDLGFIEPEASKITITSVSAAAAGSGASSTAQNRPATGTRDFRSIELSLISRL